MPSKNLFVAGDGDRVKIGIQGEFTLSLSPLDAAWLAEQLVEALNFITSDDLDYCPTKVPYAPEKES